MCTFGERGEEKCTVGVKEEVEALRPREAPFLGTVLSIPHQAPFGLTASL